MNGFGAFLGKELREIRKTWRLWVLPGIVVLLAVTGPVVTAATPAIIEATTRSMPDVVLDFPAPTTQDAYGELIANFSQLVLLAIIITGAASVAGERRGGTAALVLTKPLTRAGFLAAKSLSALLLIAAAAALGVALGVLMTVLLFDTGLIGEFVAAMGVWLVLAAFFATLMVMLSAAFGRQAPAAGVGVGVYVALFVLSGIPAARDHSPAGLLAAAGALVRGEPAALAWPILTAAGLSVLCVLGAIVVFRRKEL